MVTARTPIRSAAAIWLRISASSGEMSKRGSCARFAQQLGGDEIDEALAPARLLHHQQPAPPLHDMADCVLLAIPEQSRRILRAQLQKFESARSVVGHGGISSRIGLGHALVADSSFGSSVASSGVDSVNWFIAVSGSPGDDQPT